MIGENIQRLRKSKGLTLSDCAERANISKSYLSNIERNLNQNPSIQIIEKLAVVLDVDLRTLLGTAESVKEQVPESEWLEFVNELKKSGVEKEQLQEFRAVIEFIRWQKGKCGGSDK
ncbi:helix-turn-helix domain-containing protein [Oceanobacillus sp. 143]|uniref:Transcriptional regulator n=1 Tax=Oceanobacillus zhaokaii TaxID=2052660 RepID=A0A345PL97_9BACI|nr:helix-turn-helix transcriptional regulator [Oceanobacillus zhaokaii]AXI10777.1 transcriptional regulator [Oceanobacillus zhaokaii]QGS69686.1 helix-turn-helix domain-containing protein [Oceanobacillus sp. 143]